MSVPVLLNVLDTAIQTTTMEIVAPPTPPNTPPLTPPLRHAENCVSSKTVASVAAVQPRYVPTQAPVIDTKSNCTPICRPFTVQLSMELAKNELVALTGNTVSLGEWQLDRAVPLRPFANMQWSSNVLLQHCHNVKYRYFTYVLDANGSRLVRRWETEMQPRELKLYEINSNVDRFGEIEKGDIELQRGWLTSETIVQLKFEREQMFQVAQVDKFDPKQLLIKVVPLHEDRSTVVKDNEGPCIEVAKLIYGESYLQPQQTTGIAYKPGDVIIFHMTMPRSMKYAYALVFYTPEQKAIGRAIVAPDMLHGNSEGDLELNVTGPEPTDTQPLAKLTLPFLVVQPLDTAQLDFETTYAKYWPKSWPNLDVGHRGMGRSYIADAPEQVENTISSFLCAHKLKADMIELDVHLTMDGVPIIWHDFSVKTAPHGKEVTAPDQLEVVLIKDLSYADLKNLRVFAVIEDKIKEYPSNNAELCAEKRIFPRLIDVLEALPPTLGIDVEIKWPQRIADGGVEAPKGIDKNYFVDRVLQTVLQHGCGRPLIFSSFDADICTMLRFKQNLLPVMFLTMGQTKKWKPFMDLRTRNFVQAINFAQAFELVGTAPHAEDFLGEKGSQLMQLAHNLNLITIVWGDDCNSSERVKMFSAMGAAGICYDRTDRHVSEHKESSFFCTIDAGQLFQGQCKK